MARPDQADAPPAARRWAALVGMDNRLVRTVAGAPVNVRTKLLVAFLVIASLLVLVGVLGLRVLGQSNTRVERLGELQSRSSRYQVLEAHAEDLRQALGARGAGAEGLSRYTGGATIGGGRQWRLADLAVADTLSQVSLALDESLFDFVPPPPDERVLRRMRSDYTRVVADVNRMRRLDSNGVTGTRARPLLVAANTSADNLSARATYLATRTIDETSALIAQNRSAFGSSRDLFIAVGAVSVVLALGLGLVLSWSLIGPIQRTEVRLAEIAAGEFAGRLDVPNRDELGSLAANVNRMNDELRRLYGELEATSRHKSEFLANMSHELRTPLNAILGFSQVLRERLFGEINPKQEEYLDDILSSGNHLLSLINDVLDLSKVEAGQVELEVAPFSVRDALERGVVMVRERASEHGVRLGLDIADDVELVTGDERRIRQVIFNLLSNAVKFTPPGGRVDVTAARLDGEIQVSVADTGPGVAPADRDRIFAEFQQTEIGVRQREGTGLGLALSKRLVELHGGRIWLESEVGKGSTFVVALPAEVAAR